MHRLSRVNNFSVSMFLKSLTSICGKISEVNLHIAMCHDGRLLEAQLFINLFSFARFLLYKSRLILIFSGD